MDDERHHAHDLVRKDQRQVTRVIFDVTGEGGDDEIIIDVTPTASDRYRRSFTIKFEPAAGGAAGDDIVAQRHDPSRMRRSDGIVRLLRATRDRQL